MANEKRLIDANAAIKAMNAVDIHFWEDAEDGVEKCVNILHNAPTVDAVEVVHGRWIKKVDIVESYLADCTEFFYECSVCECASPGESPYCPNCGAKMDGDSDA